MRSFLYLLAAGMLVYLLTGLTQVRPGERAVVRRFGKVVDISGPGLLVGLPYGMDRVDRVPVDLVRRVRVGFQPHGDDMDETTPAGQLLTGDQNLVNVQVVVDYAVDSAHIEDYVVNIERSDGVIARTAEAVLAEWLAGRNVDEVLIAGKAELPAVLTRRVAALLRPYRLGVRIQGASVSYLFPPDEVKREFDQVSSAQTEIGTTVHKARQEAAGRLNAAEAERDRLEKMTAAYVKEQLVGARAEAASFEKRLRQYQESRKTNPHYLAQIWWNEISKIFAKLRDNGRIDLLDDHLSGDGLDITIAPPLPKKK
ncbi:MAG TPA: SPFH domain-containing protein [Gemmataceae bacterium]|jgi:membrane protease subunit HflK|nr:SPFH domain-containing protein [Gemmataceae bacterium]